MSSLFRRSVRTLAVTALLSVALIISGCSLFGWGETTSVSDPNNLFHVKVPANWQSSTESGFISIYADKQLPSPNESPKALSLLVFSSREESSATVPEMLDYLIDARAESRGWTGVKKTAVKKSKIGGREATYVDVSAKGTDKKEFDSRYFFVRTGGDEIFVAAIAPPGKQIDSYSKDLERLAKEWYWHGAAEKAASKEESGTAPKK